MLAIAIVLKDKFKSYVKKYGMIKYQCKLLFYEKYVIKALAVKSTFR